VKTWTAFPDKAAAANGGGKPPAGARPASCRQARIGNQAMIRQLAARSAEPGVPRLQRQAIGIPGSEKGDKPAPATTKTTKSPLLTSTSTKSDPSATTDAPFTARTIRITGWATPITIYGTFSTAVEAALADNWLSRIEISELDELPLIGSGSPKDDRDRLFRWLTGYYPGTAGSSAHDPAHRATYLSLSGYQDLPARMNVGSHSPNRYLHWLGGGADWGTVTSLVGVNLMAQSMFAQINAEPDIAPDDKAELIRLHYLRALANCNISWGPAGPRIDLTIAGTNYAPLTAAQVAQFRRMDGRTQRHLEGLRSWINSFRVSAAVGIFNIP
jgi:hypothetical protein